jgi:hypothetical protein
MRQQHSHLFAAILFSTGIAFRFGVNDGTFAITIARLTLPRRIKSAKQLQGEQWRRQGGPDRGNPAWDNPAQVRPGSTP